MKSSTKLVVIFVSLLLICFGAVSLVYSKYKILGSMKFRYDFEIGKTVGFNLDPDAIHFGRLPAGGLGKRDVYVNNTFEVPALVVIKISGDKADEWVYPSDNNFVLQPGESKKITLYCEVPKEINEEDYAGKKFKGIILILLKRI